MNDGCQEVTEEEDNLAQKEAWYSRDCRETEFEPERVIENADGEGVLEIA